MSTKTIENQLDIIINLLENLQAFFRDYEENEKTRLPKIEIVADEEHDAKIAAQFNALYKHLLDSFGNEELTDKRFQEKP